MLFIGCYGEISPRGRKAPLVEMTTGLGRNENGCSLFGLERTKILLYNPLTLLSPSGLATAEKELAMKKNHHVELDDASIMEDEITRNGMSPEADGDTFPFDPTVPLTAFPFIEAEGRYSVPRYRKMTDYLNLHFSGIIGNRICEQINRGTAEGSADTATIVSASYWREDFVTVLAELTVEIDVFHPGERRYRTETYVTRVLIDLDQELATFTDAFHDRPHRYEHDNRDVILSEYLVPIFSTNAIEEEAENMLRMLAREAYDDLTKNNAGNLAKAMGLDVVRYPVHNSVKHSILFFRDGTIQVDCVQEDGKIRVQRIQIPANTVVMNTNGKLVDNGRLDLFHECFHYEWHFCFEKLRELHQRDIRQLPGKHVLVNSQDLRGKKRRSPLQWAEWQARRGAFGLLVPRSIMAQKIREELGKHAEKDWHMGRKLDAALRTIAEDLKMAKGHMRGRAIQLGYIEAKGALNYVDRRYIEPFAFDPENGGGNYTFVLDSRELFEIYQKSKRLQKQLFEQAFVYVDGHVCRNLPAYVETMYGGGKLTKWANAHVDRCCLRFTHIYEANEEDYTIGTLNSDDSYERYYLGAIDDASDEALMKHLNRIQKRIEEMPGSFSEALTYLMKEYHITVMELADATTLSMKTIQRLRNELRFSYPLDWVIALSIGMQLEPSVSAAFLARAGYDLRMMPQGIVYQFILSCKYTQKIGEIQQFLKENQYKELVLGCDDE